MMPEHPARADEFLNRPKLAFRTLGCKQNQFDTAALRAWLLERDAQEAGSLDKADWIILNTCAVTEKALAKARGEISRLRRLNPAAQIAAVGCGVRYRQENFQAAEAMACLPFCTGKEKSFHPEQELWAWPGVIPRGKSRGYLRIQSGCDENCSFCIVPQLRGPSRSVAPSDCLQALRGLVDQGAPEIVLTGTNIALWGRDLPGGPALLDLLKVLIQHLRSARLRLSSLEPPLISPEFLEWCLSEPKICRHFHLAFQSGSPRVLDQMGRGPLSPELSGFLKDLTARAPDVCLGADFIAGFPGETESDFSQTLKWIRSVPLSYLHVFPYSERRGTRAAQMPQAVPIRDRLRRAGLLRCLNVELRKSFIYGNICSSQDVVMISNVGDNNRAGLTSNYLQLNFKSDAAPTPMKFITPLNSPDISAIQLQKTACH